MPADWNARLPFSGWKTVLSEPQIGYFGLETAAPTVPPVFGPNRLLFSDRKILSIFLADKTVQDRIKKAGISTGILEGL